MVEGVTRSYIRYLREHRVCLSRMDLGSAAGEFTNQVDFILAVGRAVVPKDLVKPDCRLKEYVWSFP
jgi:hypothetical protein